MAEDNQAAPLKILLLGDSGTGKTNLFTRFTRNKFVFNCEPTAGGSFDTHNVTVNNHIVSTEIWDLAGREKYHPMAQSLLHAAAGILLVYDISNYATFENVAGRLKAIRAEVDPKTVIKLVGNKEDLDHLRAVSTEEAQQLAVTHGLSFIETSALTNNHVQTAFHTLLTEIGIVMKSVAETTTTDAVSRSTANDVNGKKDSDVSRDATSQQPQKQERPFHVVLVDIQQVTMHQRIVCVEKPLMGKEDLQYVALSYRWGELPETLVDTHVGYIANITSFALDDFFNLCRMISLEPDLKNIKYVWVDAICVDQANHERRKATIYQMTNIYERANCILAVPDLHLRHLKNTTTYLHTAYGDNHYMYHFLHNNTDELVRLDETWMDDEGIPKELGQILARQPDPFSTRFLEYQKWHNNNDVLDRLPEALQAFQLQEKNKDAVACDDAEDDDDQDSPTPDNEPAPLDDNDEDWLMKEMIYDAWKKQIADRTISIRRSLQFLEDLITDWASRVWVISEYNIAKKKNKMKYWFVQLDIYEQPFFDFDFGGTYESVISEEQEESTTSDQEDEENGIVKRTPLCDGSDILYRGFLQTMVARLKQQTFLEMVLKSKASKHDDRLYAILPFFDKYKDKLTRVDHGGNNTTLLAIKLKLFQWMDTYDKLQLLFLTDTYFVKDAVLPTFATASMFWHHTPGDEEDPRLVFDNFDLTDKTTLQLIPPTSDNNDGADMDALYKLKLKPKMYFCRRQSEEIVNHFRHNKKLSTLLDFDHGDTFYQVCIRGRCGPQFDRYYSNDGGVFLDLIGSFERNTWVIAGDSFFGRSDQDFELLHAKEDFDGFNIY